MKYMKYTKYLIALFMLFVLIASSPLYAQTRDTPFVIVRAKGGTVHYEAGAGYLFSQATDEGSQGIDLTDVRGWFHLGGVQLPLPGDTSTGVSVEAGYSTAVVWSLWNCNRTENMNVIAGADMQVARGGPMTGSSFDFDFRLVAGYRFTPNLAVYVYFLENQTPVFLGAGWKF